MTDLPPSLRRYGRQLERAVAADLARRRRAVRLRIGAVATTLALIVVALNVLPAGDGGGGRLPAGVAPASAVERAAAALQPRPETVLHIRMLGRQFVDGGRDIRWRSETWLAPNATRSVEHSPQGVVTESEQTADVLRLWDADGGRVVEVAAPPSSPVGQHEKFRDEALELLRSGLAKVAGHQRVDGRDAVKIIAQDGSLTFLLDARDYTPIELRSEGEGGGVELRFVVYERMPLDAAARDQLSISAQHPGAPVVRDARAYHEAIERQFPNG